MKKILTALLVVVVVVIAGGVVLFWTGIGQEPYYTQIDNSRCVEIVPDAGMTHEYTLTAYDTEGQAKDITFRTERVLRERAYLKLTVAPLRGVINWEEVSLDDMPQAARACFSE